jgi:hypothetical protein
MSLSLAKQRRGDFNHQAVLSAVEIDFADMLPTFRYHHLIQDGTYLYGGFEDEAVRRYTVLRKISEELSAGLVLNASDGQNLASHPRGTESMRGGTLRYQADENGFRIRPSSGKGSLGEPFSLEMTRDVTVWDEGDVMRVEGRIVARPLPGAPRRRPESTRPPRPRSLPPRNRLGWNWVPAVSGFAS